MLRLETLEILPQMQEGNGKEGTPCGALDQDSSGNEVQFLDCHKYRSTAAVQQQNMIRRVTICKKRKMPKSCL